MTEFAKYHPGGKAQLMRGAGTDCTELFDKVLLSSCMHEKNSYLCCLALGEAVSQPFQVEYVSVFMCVRVRFMCGSTVSPL